jgi:FixJ family two-component response regulator
MDLMVRGKPNKVIALELGISERTVELHRARVMRAMKVSSAAELAYLVARSDPDN